MQSVPKWIVYGVYYVLAVVLAFQIVASAESAKQDYDQAYAYFSPEERADAELKSWLEVLSFGFYRGATRLNDELSAIIRSARSHEIAATRAAWVLLVLSASLLVFTGWRSKEKHWVSRPLVVQLLGVSLVFLAVGLIAPILSFVAYTDVAVLGKVVFKYEAKGILTSVGELINSGNWFIAALLFLFSVVTPLAKHCLSFLALRTRDTSRGRRYIGWLAAIGKWSMAECLGGGCTVVVLCKPFRGVYRLLAWIGSLLFCRLLRALPDRRPVHGRHSCPPRFDRLKHA